MHQRDEFDRHSVGEAAARMGEASITVFLTRSENGNTGDSGIRVDMMHNIDRGDIPSAHAAAALLRLVSKLDPDAVRAETENLQAELDAAILDGLGALRIAWSDQLRPGGGLVCAVCAVPVEQEPCMLHGAGPEVADRLRAELAAARAQGATQ